MKIKNLSKIYKTRFEDVKALDDINVILPKKGLVFIVGVSGSGKTTLMNMLSGVDKPTSGSVLIGNKSLYEGNRSELHGYRNSYVGLVFQDYNLIDDLNVYDNIKLPYELLGKTDYSKVDEVIKKVDIEDIKYSRINEISSGQMQRVAIARALIKDSSMILADEPTGNLDTKNEKIVFDLLKEISKDRLVVVITHGEEVANIYGDRIIEIEDGQITSDNNQLKEIEEDSPKFVKPKLSFFQQVKFTKGFISNNLARSLSILLVLMLVPLLGGILSGYVFYDVAVAYRSYQVENNSNYLSLSQKLDKFDLYYDPDQYEALRRRYPGTNFIEQIDAIIDINPLKDKIDTFYRPTIDHINIYNSKVMEVDGREPDLGDELVVTDYILAAIKHYQQVEEVTELNINGVIFRIIGVIDTDYESFIGVDFNKEPYKRMAFEENLGAYNAVYASPWGLLELQDTMTMFLETVKYTVFAGKSTPETRYSQIIYRKGLGNINPNGLKFPGSTYSLRPGYGLISEGLYNLIEWNKEFIDNTTRLVFYSYSKAKYNINLRVDNVFYSDELEVVLHPDDFRDFVEKQKHVRVLIQKDDINYDEIVRNENITNESFKHASNMRQKAEGSKIVMIEFLVVLIIIIIAFSTIINSMTMVSEKKKIGIKFSFGLKKISIVIPYVFETVLYILIGFAFATIVTKYLFPIFMQSLIYTNEADIRAFDFFYISWDVIFGWDFIVYALMLINLTVMVLTICRKSPIEIIKDL